MKAIDPTTFIQQPKSRSSAHHIRNKERPTSNGEPFYLFYFLQSDDYLLSMLIDISCKMRSKYLKKDSTLSINDELYDTKSILEQFYASLNLGPVYIFIDGLNECAHAIKLSNWLPAKLENSECKFVFTLSKSCESFAELSARKSCIVRELGIFNKDTDYTSMFARLLCSSNANRYEINYNQSNNILFAKFMGFFHELKMANHIKNPLFIQLIANEIFTFDRDIYKTHQVHIDHALSLAEGRTAQVTNELKEGHKKLHVSSTNSGGRKMSMMSSSSSESQKASVNIINSYIEEVTTLRELIQKILKRYLKKNNWSTNTSESLSVGK